MTDKTGGPAFSYPTRKERLSLWWHCLTRFHQKITLYGNGINSDPSKVILEKCWDCSKKETK